MRLLGQLRDEPVLSLTCNPVWLNVGRVVLIWCSQDSRNRLQSCHDENASRKVQSLATGIDDTAERCQCLRIDYWRTVPSSISTCKSCYVAGTCCFAARFSYSNTRTFKTRPRFHGVR
jgi:hypothetical protein